MAGEPELQPGASGEWVTHLQQRLQAAGLYDGQIDGDFGDITAEAIRLLQQAAGIDADGAVKEQTWHALGDQEQAGVTGAHEDYPTDDERPDGQLSDDGNWRWDAAANDWAPVTQDGQTTASRAGDAVEIKADEVASMMDAAEQQAFEA